MFVLYIDWHHRESLALGALSTNAGISLVAAMLCTFCALSLNSLCIVFTYLYTVSTQFVHCTYIFVHCLYTVCILFLHICTPSLYSLYTVYTLSVHCKHCSICTLYTQFLHCLYTTELVHWFYTVYTLSVQQVYDVFLKVYTVFNSCNILCKNFKCSQLERCLYRTYEQIIMLVTACTRSLYSFYTVKAQPVQNLYLVFSESLLKRIQKLHVFGNF